MAYRRTAIALAGASPSSSSFSSSSVPPKRTLALSVHFLQPDFGMTRHEILSRATAFLLAVDPPDPDPAADAVASGDASEAHMKRREVERSRELLGRTYFRSPAGGPRRDARDLGWLEFCPREHRPAAHVVAASHVLSPWLWERYYPQEWLRNVRLEHCAYSLEVYDAEPGSGGGGGEALAKFGLNPYPIHHPVGLDLALMHLKNEEGALKHLTDLGVQMHRLRSDETDFSRGENVVFEGFEVAEENTADGASTPGAGNGNGDDDDARMFFPFRESGDLIRASPQRILSETARPLPEGLCGGPAFDDAGDVAGVVEGIVPLTHGEEVLRGAASFVPSPVVNDFVQWAERAMLERVVPKEVFDQVVEVKEGNGDGKGGEEEEEEFTMPSDATVPEGMESLRGGGGGGKGEGEDPRKLSRTYDEMVAELRNAAADPREAEAILDLVRREREEVLDELKREGGDVDEIIAKVRRRTWEKQREIIERARREMEAEAKSAGLMKSEYDDIVEAEVVSSVEKTDKNAGADDSDEGGEKTTGRG